VKVESESLEEDEDITGYSGGKVEVEKEEEEERLVALYQPPERRLARSFRGFGVSLTVQEMVRWNLLYIFVRNGYNPHTTCACVFPISAL
jgi:hypothetical protein